MNEIKLFEKKELGFKVRTILNPDGSISVNAEDTAIGYGWTQTQVKNGKEYTSIRWETLNGYCKDLGFPNKLGKDDYLPESLFYMLGFKAGNDRALKYQQWLATEVLPSLRKTGSYEMPGGRKLSQEEMMRIQLGMLDKQGERLDGVEERVDHLENTMTVDYEQSQILQKTAKCRALDIVGGKDSRAYTYQYPSKGFNDKPQMLFKKLMSRLWHDYQDYFKVNSRNNTPTVRFEEACKYLENWEPPINLKLDIEKINAESLEDILL